MLFGKPLDAFMDDVPVFQPDHKHSSDRRFAKLHSRLLAVSGPKVPVPAAVVKPWPHRLDSL